MDAKKLVIVGGGFAGGRLAYEIEKAKVPVSVTLVDTKDFYEVFLCDRPEALR
jgi:NADH dehydrogenase FAD-containing subunit